MLDNNDAACMTLPDEAITAAGDTTTPVAPTGIAETREHQLAGIAIPAVDSILFLIDAATDVEADYLRQQIADWRLQNDFRGISECVRLDIARSQENIAADALAAELEHHPSSLVVPLRLTWLSSVDGKNTAPRLRDLFFGNPRKPNNRKAAAVLKNHPELTRFIVAEPAGMDALRQRYQSQTGNPRPDDKTFARYIAGQAGLALDVAERKLRGGRYKVPRRVAEALKSDPGFRDELRNIRKDAGLSRDSANTEVAKIMDQLIARPSTFWQDVFGSLSHYVSSLGYNKTVVVNRDRLQAVRQTARDYPTIFLFTHKSHIDAFVLNAVLFDEDFPPPHIIGGENMAFLGLGFIAHRSNIVFIRRSFQNSPLYKLVLRYYLGYLLNKRFPLSWAFEGTRSRTGKLMPPRYGILKYVLESMSTRDVRDLHIIPVAINYDLIEDVKDYATEQQGGIKRPESLKWFYGYLKGMRRPMGHIHMDFGDAVVVDKAPDLDDKLALQKLAFRVGVEANRVSPLTPVSIACMVLLGASPRALTKGELMGDMVRCVDWARERNIPMAAELEAAEPEALITLLDILVTNNLVTRYDGGPEVVYAIPDDQHGEASYYRNSIAHHFVSKAIIEMALAKLAVQSSDQPLTAFWDEIEELRDLFKFEFFYADKQRFTDDIRAELSRHDVDWERKLADDEGYANKFLARFLPLTAHAVLLPYIEGYRIVAEIVSTQGAASCPPEKEVLTKSLAYARQALLQRRISSPASIGKITFQNAYKLLDSRGLIDASGAETEQARRELSQSIRMLARRLERLRAISLQH